MVPVATFINVRIMFEEAAATSSTATIYVAKGLNDRDQIAVTLFKYNDHGFAYVEYSMSSIIG